MSETRCPGCGRPVRGRGSKCMYCGAPLGGFALGAVTPVARVAPAPPVEGEAPGGSHAAEGRTCPGCQRPARGRAVRCFYCGHDLPRTAPLPERSCPRCLVTMTPVTATWVMLEVCPRCQGTFFDRGEFERAQRTSADRLDWLKRELQPASADGAAALICPGCRRTMRALTTGGVDAVAIDSCPACQGMWLDAGEAERLHRIALSQSARGRVDTWEQPEVQIPTHIKQMVEEQAREGWRRQQRNRALLSPHGEVRSLAALDLLADIVSAFSDT